jgi:hypothetical protein
MTLRIFDIGDHPTLLWYLYSDEDRTTPSDATVALTVKAPDGTTITPSVTHVATGQYSAAVSITMPGTWSYRWVATGALVAADEGQFSARPSNVL